MARSQSAARRSKPAGRPTPLGRPSLVPEDPLPGWKALLQALFLLGVPILLLLITRVILRGFFPELGY
jgi:hypothetical protein